VYISEHQMKKNFALAYLFFSVLSMAQFKDNVFDSDQSKVEQRTHDAELAQASDRNTFGSGVEGNTNGTTSRPGNPGEPAPIDDYIPYLMGGALFLIAYSQRKKIKFGS